MTSEELERVLLQKEGESLKDNVVHQSRSGGAGGKRAIGKAVAKGGLLLKGKNPGNVQIIQSFLGDPWLISSPRFNVKKMIYGHGYQPHQTYIGKQSLIRKPQDRSTSIFNFPVYYGCVLYVVLCFSSFILNSWVSGLERVC